jgi:heptosyltransferase-2
LPPRTALIVKLAAIGDVVMALPMVTALREMAPECRITWLAGQTSAPLLSHVAAVDDRAILAGSTARKAAAVAAAWRMLAGRSFDLVLIAHSDARYQRLAQTVRSPERRWLGRRSPRPGLLPGRNHTAEYVRLVTGNDTLRTTLPAPPTVDPPLPDALARELATFNPGAAALFVLAPGGARNPGRTDNLRRWPADRYVELARRLHAGGHAVVLVGDAGDAWVRTVFASTPVLDLIGRTDLPALVALFRRCALVVAHDSGPLHLARLAGAPTVGLFGPTMPHVFVPPGSSTHVLWPGAALPCAPCYDGREFAACDNNACMQAISVDAVAAAIAAQRPSLPRANSA